RVATERNAGRGCRGVKQQVKGLFNTIELRVIYTSKQLTRRAAEKVGDLIKSLHAYLFERITIRATILSAIPIAACRAHRQPRFALKLRKIQPPCLSQFTHSKPDLDHFTWH